MNQSRPPIFKSATLPLTNVFSTSSSDPLPKSSRVISRRITPTSATAVTVSTASIARTAPVIFTTISTSWAPTPRSSARLSSQRPGKNLDVAAEIYGKDKMKWEKEVAETRDLVPPS